MSDETTNDNASHSAPDIDNLVSQLSTLLAQLLATARASTDPVELLQLNNEYAAVQTVLNQAVQVQLAADDLLFNQAVIVLKTQGKLLDGMEAQVKGLVKDVAIAGKIIGCVTQSLALIARI